MSRWGLCKGRRAARAEAAREAGKDAAQQRSLAVGRLCVALLRN